MTLLAILATVLSVTIGFTLLAIFKKLIQRKQAPVLLEGLAMSLASFIAVPIMLIGLFVSGGAFEGRQNKTELLFELTIYMGSIVALGCAFMYLSIWFFETLSSVFKRFQS